MSRHIVIFAAFVGLVASSAIPMWEFLTRGEKMSHLFNMFVKQVADHCDSSNMPDCQKVLLVYGLTNLAKMEDDSLDKMDPYQRGANDIIWESMMHGSYKKKTTTPDDHRDYYTDAFEPSTSEGNQLGSQEEASSKVEAYSGNRYIVGPMVVRVRPDGSPVPEDAPLPKDEDAEEYQAMRAKPVPSLAELSSKSGHFDILSVGKHHQNYDILSSSPGHHYEEILNSSPRHPYEDILKTGPQTSRIHHENILHSSNESRQAEKDNMEVSARHVSSSVSTSRQARHN